MKTKNKLIISLIPVLILFLAVPAAFAQTIDLQYRSTDIKDVIRSLALVSGRNIVVDDSAQGEVTVQLDDVTFQEAFTHLLNIKDLDYRDEDDILIVASPDRLEELYDSIIQNIYTLDHLDPEVGANILAETYPGISAQPLSDQGRLVLAGPENKLEPVLDLLAELDQPSQDDIQVFQVEYQSAADVADYILDFFPDLTVRPRESVGDIIVSGRERDIAEAEELIEQLDTPDRTISQRYRPTELSPQELLEEVGAQSEWPSVSISLQDDEIRLEGPARQVNQLQESLSAADEREPVITHKQYRVDYLPIEDLTEIINQFESNISISQNPTDRTIIVQGDERALARISDLVDKVDSPRRQVMLEARIEEISHSDLKERGIDLDELRDFTTIGVNYDEGIPTGIDITMPELFTFFDSNTSSQTLANPRLMTIDGEEASLIIADQVPIKVAERETDAGRVVPVFEYRDVGITLSFTPRITRDNTILLDLSPEVSSLGREASDALLPVIQTRTLENQISLRDGQTFAIGGLIQEEHQEQVRSVPLLSELPILGNLFKFTERDQDKTEVVIFITPHIVDIMSEKYADTETEHRVEFNSAESSPEENTADTETKTDSETEETESEDAETNSESEETTSETDASPETAAVETEEPTPALEEVLADIRAQREANSQNSVKASKPERDELKQITFRARLGRRDDWPDQYEYEFTSQQELEVAELAELYNVNNQQITTANQGDEFIYTIIVPGNQVYQAEEGTTAEKLAEKTGISAERIKAANQLNNGLIQAEEIIILPYQI